MNRRSLILTAILVFVAAIAGVAVGRLLLPAPQPPQMDLHAVLHREITLDADQERRLHLLEQDFAVRRAALETEMRAENVQLADAIAAEHRIGPRVSGAVDASHRTMGELQKASLAHVFAMRALLRPDQARRFDAAVTKALTDDRH
jgi:hypothetical protein